MRLFGTWRREAGAFGWLLGADAVARVLGQAAILITARRLGPEGFGVVAVAWAALSVLLVVGDLGIGEAAVQRLTGRPQGAATFADEVAPIRVLLGAPYAVIGVITLARSGSEMGQACGLVLLAGPFALGAAGRALQARIHGNFRQASGWSASLLLSQWVGAAAGAIALHTSVGAVLGMVVCILALSLFALLQEARVPTARGSAHWLKAGAPFLFTSAAVVLYSRGDRLLLAAIAGSAVTGPYAAAYSIVMLPALAGAAAHAAVLPRLLTGEPAESGLVLRRCGLLALILSAPAAALALTAPVIIRSLYGGAFSSAVIVLQLLSPLVVLYVVNPVLSSLLIGANRQRELGMVAGFNLMFAAVVYPFAIDAFGVRGAATASVLVEVCGCLLMLSLLTGKTKFTADFVGPDTSAQTRGTAL